MLFFFFRFNEVLKTRSELLYPYSLVTKKRICTFSLLSMCTPCPSFQAFVSAERGHALRIQLHHHQQLYCALDPAPLSLLLYFFFPFFSFLSFRFLSFLLKYWVTTDVHPPPSALPPPHPPPPTSMMQSSVCSSRPPLHWEEEEGSDFFFSRAFSFFESPRCTNDTTPLLFVSPPSPNQIGL